MSFIVEDGTGLSTAVSLASVEFADSYFSSRGVTGWASLPNEQKEFNLIKATDYINIRFKYKGDILKDDQALAFPRTDILVPIDVKKATCEYALRASQSDLAPDLARDESGMKVLSRKEVIGPIEESVTFASTGTSSDITLFKSYPAADLLLSKYIKRGGNRVIR